MDAAARMIPAATTRGCGILGFVLGANCVGCHEMSVDFADSPIKTSVAVPKKESDIERSILRQDGTRDHRNEKD